MNIDFAIVSSDDNPFYLDFWPVVSKLWRERMKIEPILLYFGNKDLDQRHGTIIKMRTVPGVPLYLQCACSRLWYPGTVPNAVSILSDIDMLPLSKKYFIDQIKDVATDKYVHLNPCFESYGQVAMCYNVARGDTFLDVLKIPEKWEDAAFSFLSTKPMRRHTESHPLWFVDETILTNRVLSASSSNRIVLLPRTDGQNGRRIDRSNWGYDLHLLRQGHYYDCHSARPFSAHQQDILTIAKESI